MLFKTKLLLILGTCGVSGGIGAGVYYIKNRKIDVIKKDPSQGSGSASNDSPGGEAGNGGVAG